MLKRRIESEIEQHLASASDKILVLQGARQIGKSYVIRQVGQKMFRHYVEINFVTDDDGDGLFRDVRSTDQFYFALGMYAKRKLGDFSDTLIFLDEVQHYPQYLTLLKFFREDKRYRFICSGSMLGITLKTTTSIPIGSIIIRDMMQLDFEEFLWANGIGEDFIANMRSLYERRESLPEPLHNKMMELFRRYLIVGGMPDVVNAYLESHNVAEVRTVQNSIMRMYADDASKYEADNNKKLKICRIYGMIPSQMENKKKRIVAQDIQGLKGDRFSNYEDEFEYLITSGVVIDVHAVSNPKYPLSESVQKNLLKLYINDVGFLTNLLYGLNLMPLLNDDRSINLGSVYENVVAQELKSRGHRLFYYDNRHNGEVDYLIDDYSTTSILPIEVKSGKDYTVHSALSRLLSVADYNVRGGVVLSNSRDVVLKERVSYMPIYYTMFLGSLPADAPMYF